MRSFNYVERKSIPHLKFLLLVTGFIHATILMVPGQGGENGNQGMGGIRVNSFFNDESTFFSNEKGLPDNDVRAVAVTKNGTIYAATAKGLAEFKEGKFLPVKGADFSVSQMIAFGNGLYFSHGNVVSQLVNGQVNKLITFAEDKDNKTEILSLAYNPKISLLCFNLIRFMKLQSTLLERLLWGLKKV